MFCPRCGQQAAEEVSFCSRCGLPLGAAARLVGAGGELARADAGGGLTPRQRGTRKGLLITAGGALSFGVAVLLTAFKEDLFVFLVPAGLVLVLGVVRMLYGLLLEEHTPDRKLSGRSAARPELDAPRAPGTGLPPARTVPVSAYAKPGAQTSDMAAPQSVAENTTRLLDD